MIRRLEHVVFAVAIDEALAKIYHLSIELLWDEDLVRQAGKRKIKVIGEFAILQFFRLRKALPDALKVRRERVLKVDKRRSADVVADNEQKKCPLILADNEAWVSKGEKSEGHERTSPPSACQRDPS